MEKEKFVSYCKFELGYLEIVCDETAVIGISIVDEIGESTEMNGIMKEAHFQIEEYFAGKRRKFDLNLSFNGTEFQNKVWKELLNITFGETISYKELAKRIGNEKACRAVGGANNKNPIGIVVPCHRVVGIKGDLIGYYGGVDKKKWLLEFEKNSII